MTTSIDILHPETDIEQSSTPEDGGGRFRRRALGIMALVLSGAVAIGGSYAAYKGADLVHKLKHMPAVVDINKGVYPNAD